MLTSDWLGCCCWGIEFDWGPDPRSPPAVMVVLVPDDKLDMGCWEDGGGLLMCAVGGGGAGPWPPWWGRPVTISAVLVIRSLMISYVLPAAGCSLHRYVGSMIIPFLISALFLLHTFTTVLGFLLCSASFAMLCSAVPCAH